MDEINTVLIQQIENATGLQFIPEALEGNLCYRNNNSDLRDEFKESFDLKDLNSFLNAFSSVSDIDIPKTSEEFWATVNKGKL